MARSKGSTSAMNLPEDMGTIASVSPITTVVEIVGDFNRVQATGKITIIKDNPMTGLMSGDIKEVSEEVAVILIDKGFAEVSK